MVEKVGFVNVRVSWLYSRAPAVAFQCFMFKMLFYLTQVRWPLVFNVILQLWSCPLIFNVLLWPQVSILFSKHQRKITSKTPFHSKAVSQITQISMPHSEVTYNDQRCCLANLIQPNDLLMFSTYCCKRKYKEKETNHPFLKWIVYTEERCGAFMVLSFSVLVSLQL